MAAAVVLAVAMAAITESISSSLSAATRVRRETMAYDVAADRLHRACAAAGPTMTTEGAQIRDGAEFRSRVKPELSDEDGLEHLSCTVSWTSVGEAPSVTLHRRRVRPSPGAPGS